MFQESIDAFKKILAHDARNQNARYNLAVAYYGANLYNDAAGECVKLLEQNQNNAQAHFLLGNVYNKLGKATEAKTEFNAYQKLIFGNP